MQPRTLGRYEIVKELGRGAMGRVFLAHDPKIQRDVALKTVQTFSALPEAERAEARERFLAEARAAGKLMHPGLVTLFDVGEAGGALYLAMELVEGTTLDVFCKPDALLSPATTCELVAGVAETLDYAHGSGVVHRDVKPANLMRVGATAVKVMDFGLALAVEGQVSQDGALLGTPSYMSPEQIRGETVDGRSDLFSLAVVLFEMLTGDKPFGGDSISSIIYRIVNEEPRDAAVVSDRVPAELAGFLRQALAKSPEDRYPTGEAFAAALREAARPLGPAVVAAAETEVSAPVAGAAGTSPAAAEKPEPVAAAGPTVLPPAATPRHRRRSSGSGPFITVIVLLLVGAAAAAYIYRDRIPWPNVEQPVVWWEATVRTEPAGLPVSLDGEPLAGEVVRFQSTGPFGILAIEQGCRRVERPIEPTDGAGEIVLVMEPEALSWRLDPGVEATVQLNGEPIGQAPMDLQLDLCRDNRLELAATGFRPATIDIAAQASVLEARTRLGALQLEAIPLGRLLLPEAGIPLVWYVDGERLGRDTRDLELPEGDHEVRLKNDTYWIDERRTVRVVGNETIEPELAPPALATLVVQAFPANCKVFLRRPGGKWKYVDDTPSRRRIAVGSYEVRVTLNPTGESQERSIELVGGENPPVRVSFARRS